MALLLGPFYSRLYSFGPFFGPKEPKGSGRFPPLSFLTCAEFVRVKVTGRRGRFRANQQPTTGRFGACLAEKHYTTGWGHSQVYLLLVAPHPGYKVANSYPDEHSNRYD
jgi:hypothetical protein